jgi:alanine racemase
LASTQQKFDVHTRPNWTEISLSALAANYRAIVRHLATSRIASAECADPHPVTPCCVVKCDAYGHGVIEVARALEGAGASWLGVTSTEEGVAVRGAGVRLPILVMTGFWRGEEEAVLRRRLTPAIATLEHVEALEAAARRVRLTERIPVHLKVDTGMARLGVSPRELPALAARLAASPVIELQGVFSHLAESEVLDSSFAAQQYAAFDEAVAKLAAAGLNPRYRHLANTAATVARPESWHNMVRPGLALYGYALPSQPQPAKCGLAGDAGQGHAAAAPAMPLSPVLTWKTRIIALREIAAGTSVGYNRRWQAARPTRIAVLPVGYGDGFNRHLSNRGQVIVDDRYAPIAGNVSMDLTMIDVTDIPQAAVGDEVLLIGRSANCSLGADDHARIAGTVVYEILCGLSPRIPRIYVE